MKVLNSVKKAGFHSIGATLQTRRECGFLLFTGFLIRILGMVMKHQYIQIDKVRRSQNCLLPTCCLAALSRTVLLHQLLLHLALLPAVLGRPLHHRGEADCSPALGPTHGVTGTQGSGGVSGYAVNWGRHLIYGVR